MDNEAQSFPPINHTKPTSGSPQLQVPSKLRQLIYSAFYTLDRGDKWIDLAPLGNALKRVEKDFSIQKYHFSKLSELLESVSDLVEFDKIQNQARLKDPSDIKALLTQAFHATSEANDWVHLSSIAQAINQLSPTFSASKYGFDKFKDFLESRPDLIELRKDEERQSPQYYTRLKASPTLRNRTIAVQNKAEISDTRGDSAKSRNSKVVRLSEYAFFPNLYGSYGQLGELVLPEKWYFGAKPPKNFQYPILKNYLEYTFIRLQYEDKVAISADGNYSAFNTGLFDRKYEPIYALLGRDKQGHSQAWYLISFCIPGEGREGKVLNEHFGRLKSANYFDYPGDMFYDIHADIPEVDWRHILQDNPDRLPLRFLQTYAPRGFAPQNFGQLSVTAQKEYKQAFSAALKKDLQTYRTIVARCESALRFALATTQLNYKTAIPYYNPRKNRLQLLLPLSLMDEAVDCALVVDRPTGSKRYVGHTILPLSWAYSNARLIGRLETPWLSADLGTSTEADMAFDADPEDVDPEANNEAFNS
ncbi:MAG: DUF3825 domain-containing protein [Leptolyngbya sp. SIO1D8]|nr:DUF3825 domain-containing protein [Leptolyngbya sp. SIO1D8]